MFEQFPYSNLHDLNLDWIIKRVTEAYGPDNPPENVVVSVNGEQGVVTLYTDAHVSLPNVTDTNWNIYRGIGTNGKTTGIQFQEDGPAQRIDGTFRYDMYDAGNPPPYPVTMVNGQTGEVVISVPVQSVNGQTGHVILYPNATIEFPQVDGDVWTMKRTSGPEEEATGIRFENGAALKRIDGANTYQVYDEQNQPPYPVISVGTLTGAVAILDTSVVTDNGTQKIKIAFPVTSVDGQTGNVTTWGYSSNAHLKIPLETNQDQWGFYRDTAAGELGIEFEVYNDALSGYITLDDGVNPLTRLKILTPADIPSSSGVVSINGHAGVVTLYAGDIDINSTDPTTIEEAINSKCPSSVIAFIENGSTSSANYSTGAYILRNGQLYMVSSTISAGDSFSTTNLSSVSNISQEVNKLNKTVHNMYWHTIYSGGSTFANDIGSAKTLPSEHLSFLELIIYFNSISSSTKAIVTIPYPYTLSFMLVYYSANFSDIIRLSANATDGLTIVSSSNNNQIFIQSISGLGSY